MSQSSERVRALREAVRIAQDDATLRRLLADAMLAGGALGAAR